MILTLIVGGDMEQNFQRAMIVYGSPMDILFASPIAIVLVLV